MLRAIFLVCVIVLPVKLAHKRHPPLHVFLLFHVHAQPEDGDDNIFIAVTMDDNAPLTSRIIIGVATDITPGVLVNVNINVGITVNNVNANTLNAGVLLFKRI
jgi:hypothetical protein